MKSGFYSEREIAISPQKEGAFGFSLQELDKKIIHFVIYEKSNKEIAEKTGYSVGTIKFRLSILFKSYGVKTKVGLIREFFKINF